MGHEITKYAMNPSTRISCACAAVALANLPVWAAEPDPLTQDIVMLGDPKVTAAIESGSQAQAAFVGGTRDQVLHPHVMVIFRPTPGLTQVFEGDVVAVAMPRNKDPIWEGVCRDMMFPGKLTNGIGDVADYQQRWTCMPAGGDQARWLADTGPESGYLSIKYARPENKARGLRTRE